MNCARFARNSTRGAVHRLAAAVLIACWISCGTNLHSAPAAGVEVPAGIVYKRTDPITLAAARGALNEALAGGAQKIAGLFSEAVICGPAYWARIKEDPMVHAAKPAGSKFHIPNTATGETETMDGATFKDAPSKLALASRLAADLGKSFEIRPPNADELRVYWAMIPFDIVEPIWIVVAGGKSYLFDQAGGAEGYRVMWVDEISRYEGEKSAR